MSAVTAKLDGGQHARAVLDQIAQRLGKPVELRVGFLEDADYPADTKGKSLKVAQVAFWNEFGTVRAPARPFMRQTIAKESPYWGSDLAGALKAVAYDARRALLILGSAIKDQIQTTIQRWPADNAKSTADRKGFNHGLVDTEHMQRSVDYELRDA